MDIVGPVTPPTDAATRTRPTRAQQRESTKAALLDATIESLIENGYAATSARGIAERAGVSQGAQQHHYPTKAALVDAAVVRLAEQVGAAVVATSPPSTDPRVTVAMLVDRLWVMHNNPLATAIIEFVMAARTDPDVAGGVIDLLARVDTIALSIAAQLLPDLASRRGSEDWLRITMATMRGVVMVAAIPGADPVTPTWPAIRAHILRSFDALHAES